MSLLSFLLPLFSVSSSTGEVSGPIYVGHEEEVNPLFAELIEGSNSFGYDLTNQLYLNTSKNILFSPFSITSSLALLYPGSAGDTQSQLLEYGKFPADLEAAAVTDLYFELQESILDKYDGTRTNSYDKLPSTIMLANKLFISNSLNSQNLNSDIKSSFESDVTDLNGKLHAQLFHFDSSDADKINNWVYDDTNGKIDRIINNDTDISGWDLAALNAMYINASFKDPFNPTYTSLNQFYSNVTRLHAVSEIHLMHQIDYFMFYRGQYYDFLRVDLTDDNLFLLYALPTDPTLTQNGLIHHGALVKHALNKLENTFVALALPKMAIDVIYDLKTDLAGLGISDMFDENLADLSAISDEPLFVNSFMHQSRLEMNEHGIMKDNLEGTVLADDVALGYAEPVLFKADHPFQMFVIDGDHENALLFMAAVNVPGIPEGSPMPTFFESGQEIWTNFSKYDGQKNSAAQYGFGFVAVIVGLWLVN